MVCDSATSLGQEAKKGKIKSTSFKAIRNPSKFGFQKWLRESKIRDKKKTYLRMLPKEY